MENWRTRDYFNFFDRLPMYPVCLIVGEMGSGKSAYATMLAYTFQKLGANIYANFTLKGIPYTKIDPEKVFLPDNDTLHDGVLFWDEIKSTGGSKYDFFTDSSQDIAEFMTQIRKRNLAIFMLSQRYNYGVKDVRELIAYFYEVTKNPVAGFTNVQRFYKDARGMRAIDAKPITYYIAPFFDNYITQEILTKGNRSANGKKDKPETVKK